MAEIFIVGMFTRTGHLRESFTPTTFAAPPAYCKTPTLKFFVASSRLVCRDYPADGRASLAGVKIAPIRRNRFGGKWSRVLDSTASRGSAARPLPDAGPAGRAGAPGRRPRVVVVVVAAEIETSAARRDDDRNRYSKK